MGNQNKSRELEETEMKFITYDDLRRILDAVEEYRASTKEWCEDMGNMGTYIEDRERNDAVIHYAEQIADNTLKELDKLVNQIWSICEDLASGKLKVRGDVWDVATWPVYK